MVPTPSRKSNEGDRIDTSHSRIFHILHMAKNVHPLYTDDLILEGPDQEEIDQVIEDLKRAKLILNVEGDL